MNTLRTFGIPNLFFQTRTFFSNFRLENRKIFQIYKKCSFTNKAFNFYPYSYTKINFFSSNPTPTIVPIEGFYKRPLPPHLIPFSSAEGKELFKETLKTSYLESYWTLAEQFHTQSEPASTLAMVLNALQIDPNRLWKHPWRWFTENLLDCCTPLEVVKKQGITFDDFACLAKCNGAEIESFRAEEGQILEEKFRDDVKAACAQESKYLVVNFSRAMLGQTGDGHFSAIAGYNEKRDMVLVMDVAKFKYPAFWCPLNLLFKAMFNEDAATGRPRGYFLIQKAQRMRKSVCKLTADADSWPRLSAYLNQTIPSLLQKENPATIEKLVELVFQNLPKEIRSLIKFNKKEENMQQIMEQVRETKLFAIVNQVFMDPTLNSGLRPELATVMLLACPSQLYKDLSLELRSRFKELRDTDSLPSELVKEVIQLRFEMLNLTRECDCIQKEKQCNKNT